jgi:hypothetical protein
MTACERTDSRLRTKSRPPTRKRVEMSDEARAQLATLRSEVLAEVVAKLEDGITNEREADRKCDETCCDRCFGGTVHISIVEGLDRAIGAVREMEQK